MTDLQNRLRELYGLRRFGIKLGLDTIRAMLDGLGNPHRRFRAVHLAGSNGKGSVASALATILAGAGQRVGLYTSPHLVRFNERFCVNGRPVSDEALAAAHEAVRTVPTGDRSPTFFEFATAMAFHLFAEAKVDWAVIETGMGGRLDATNVLDPALAVITNISLEHAAYLGDSLELIAAEKGGIIKPGVPAVTGAREAPARGVLAEIARGRSAPLFFLGTDFRAIPEPDGTFQYEGLDGRWENMRAGLAGGFQVDNAALTLAACELLVRDGVNLPKPAVRTGLARNRWPGRLEVVAERPRILLDGAHNLAAARLLAAYLDSLRKESPVTLVVGILDDKPHRDMLEALLPVCRRVIYTQARNERALPAETLRDAGAAPTRDTMVLPDVGEALAAARQMATPDETICVAGSLYVVGEAKEALEREGFPAYSLTEFSAESSRA
ncbi:MAG: bifunctional folylpolyglutamate synthase/dihydrofolate synthase [Thermodesulfobacteriota bacterium]